MRRRLEIARGLMHSPRVLFLDEPTIGLDPQTRRSIWAYIRELKEREEITIFMTTHYMDEAEWCDRIAIMDHGEIVALDTPEALKAEVGTDRVTIHTDDDEAAIAALARAVRHRGAGRPRARSRSASRPARSSCPRLFAESRQSADPRGQRLASRRSTTSSCPTPASRSATPRRTQSKHRNRVMMQMMTGGRR